MARTVYLDRGPGDFTVRDKCMFNYRTIIFSVAVPKASCRGGDHCTDRFLFFLFFLILGLRKGLLPTPELASSAYSSSTDEG